MNIDTQTNASGLSWISFRDRVAQLLTPHGGTYDLDLMRRAWECGETPAEYAARQFSPEYLIVKCYEMHAAIKVYARL